MANETENSEEQELVGLLAQFDDPDSLIAACTNAREAGYKKMDAYTPFPVHGIDPALGIKRSFLPFVVLTVCLLYTSPSPRDRTRSRMPSSA